MLKTLRNLPGKIKNEWEKSVFFALLLVGMAGLAFGLGKLRLLLKEKQHSGVAKPEIEKVFQPWAFEFLQKHKGVNLPFDHCFIIKRPPGWRPPQPKLAKVKGPPKVPVKIIRVVKKGPPKQGHKPPVKKNVTKGGPPAKVKPKLPIRHYLVYKGFIRTMKGHMAAYLTEEKVQGNKKTAGIFSFLRNGGKFGSYVIISFDEEAVVLKDAASGKVLEIFIGDRHHYATTPGG